VSDERDQHTREQLSQLWRREVARAQGYRPQPTRPRRGSKVTVIAQLAAVVLVFAVIVAALYVSLPSGPASSPAPSPVPSPSALVDGLPISIDGQPVLRGDDLRAAIASSTDDTPFLAGGYLQSRVSVFNCRVVPADESADAKAIDQCFSFGLYDQLVGGLVIWVSRGDAGLLTADMIGVDRPVVVRLHTHDSRCKQPYCAQTPVLVSVAWLGAIGTGGVSPTPHPTPPPTKVTRDQAIANARAASAEGDFPSNSTVRSVEVELETEALPAWWPQEVDPWVWAIILDAPDGRAELVVLDYVSGDLIYSQSPLP
jgi:hypothetical protein